MSAADSTVPITSPAPTLASGGAPVHDQGMRAMLLLTMAVWGGNVSIVKILVERFDPILISSLRVLIACITLLAVLRLRGLHWPRLSRRQWIGLAVCSLLMVYINQIVFTLGVQRTAAANAALIIALNPLVSSLIAALWLGDRLSPARLAGVALGFGGVASVVLSRPGAVLGQGGLGDLLVLASVTTWVVGGVIVQRLARQLDSAVVSTVVFVLAAPLLLGHALLDPAVHLPSLAQVSLSDVLLLCLSGMLATALGGLIWNQGLVRLGVARVALYAYWVPLFGVGFAVLLLGEPVTVWHGLGLAAVLAGTWLGTRTR